jgi:ADP-ribosylglycohydrolase
MLLGLAVGDSLGVTSEGLAPEHRLGLFGEIRDYLAIPKTGLRVGIPSDDTQLAFWTLEQMLEDDGFVPENIARRFATDQIFGIGATVMAFRDAFEEKPHPWWECGQPSAGDGALMRIAPMVVPHLRMPSAAMWTETALCSAITHNDTASISSCVAFVAMLWDLLGCTEPPEPTWWVDRFVEVAMDLETDTVYRPRAGDHQGFAGKLTDFVEQTVPEAHAQGLPVVEACESWYSGAYLLETVPSVLYILMRHGHDAEEAIVRAVNDTRDNDTIAAIVGAAVGALHGREALPDRWLEGHTGRTKADDDGRIFELLELARKRWWEDSA